MSVIRRTDAPRRGRLPRGLAGAALWMGVTLSAAAEPPATSEPLSEAEAFPKVERLFQARCSLPTCHAGPEASGGMRLEPGQIYRSTVNIVSRREPGAVRIAPGRPDLSLLYRVLLPPEEGRYPGHRMPMGKEKLSPAEIEEVRAWIASFPAALWGSGPPPGSGAASGAAAGSEVAARPRLFLDGTLAHLATPDTLGAHRFEFRFAHRFRAPVDDAGAGGLFGLDGSAWISLALAYAPHPRWEIGIRHTNLRKAEELYFKTAIVRQGDRGAPLSISYHGGFSHLRQDGTPNDDRLTAQLVLGRSFGERLSLLLVPAWASHTNYLDPDESGGTFALGAGGEWRLRPGMALTAEWVGQIAGVEAPYQSGSVGWLVATERHVFHLVLTNTEGLQTDLFIPGGDLDWGEGDVRLGFNISRVFGRR